ncbi:dihydrofolate reductase [Pradoshia sp. D12]|uniref:dihydrofolate reductase n=1 Tax=Bacillaceae TaxID=186817 RepID=UPI00112DC08E|nr:MULTISPECIES: dihydrofolate reductase [Bacillaceae]QFK71711.1 dihydrofolate reductase [Pradoshia sp. D12]TPF73506.1 dihydrofolate reductase [Bacillus sp. D12]
MFSIVVAHDRNRVIGINNNLPWRIPADMVHVKQTTMGKILIMGRKTFESIGKPLPGRTNVVLTKDPSWVVDGVKVVHSVDEILQIEKDTDTECVIFGGQVLFEQLLPYVSKIYLTYIDHHFEGDTFFPVQNYDEEWELLSSEKGPKDERNPYDYYFKEYIRK